eukprot:10036165-Alexandrium_andersonii.AAC.1
MFQGDWGICESNPVHAIGTGTGLEAVHCCSSTCEGESRALPWVTFPASSCEVPPRPDHDQAKEQRATPQ